MEIINHPKIAVFSYGRKNSQRCPNKLLRKFYNTTVLDIFLNKLNKFKNSYFGGFEKEFQTKCDKHKVKFIQRSEKSVNIDYPIVEAIRFIEDINFEYLLLINACLPFLKIETINNFLSFVIKNKSIK